MEPHHAAGQVGAKFESILLVDGDETLVHVEKLRPLVPPGSTMPDLVLRFILHHPAVTTVIPGMRKARNVEANLASSDAPPLKKEMLQALHAHRWQRDWKLA